MVPDAQLIELVEFGPYTPNSIATLHDAAPPNTASASEASTLRRPPPMNFCIWSSAYATPPSADPIIEPTRSRSSRSSTTPESLSAMRDDTTENCAKRSKRRLRRSSR